MRDLLHVDDLLRLIDYQLTHFAELNGEIFNVGGGRDISLSLLETTQICEEITGHKIDISRVVSDRQGDVPLYITDASKIIQRTGWQPQIAPRKALESIFDWICSHEVALMPILG